MFAWSLKLIKSLLSPNPPLAGGGGGLEEDFWRTSSSSTTWGLIWKHPLNWPWNHWWILKEVLGVSIYAMEPWFVASTIAVKSWFIASSTAFKSWFFFEEVMHEIMIGLRKDLPWIHQQFSWYNSMNSRVPQSLASTIF